MKRKFNISKVFSNIKIFITSNKLFLLYIIFSVLIGLCLRYFTIGSIGFYKAILSDLFVALLIGSFSYLMYPKSRYGYFLAWIIFASILAIGNTIYYDFYQSFLSINLIDTASMVGQVNDSLWAKMHFAQFLYFIFPISFILIHRYFVKNELLDNVVGKSAKKIFINSLKVCFCILLFVVATITRADRGKFQKLWNRESLVHRYGLYVYTINDLIQSISPKINTIFGYDEAAYKFREFYACKIEEKKQVNEYTNIFKGKNVIFIHSESIQNFLIDLKINGKEVTPFYNKLAREGIYFNKFYPQISVGTSSDTEFTLTTGLMPSSSGTVFVNYYDRTYKGMPEYFRNMGYYTFSAHANNAEYWNRKEMHNNLGYTDFYDKASFNVPDESDENYIGLGLSDKSFFEQFIPIFKNIKENSTPFFGTIITLTNHSPFSDVEKYGEFDVTMNYSYVDEDGKKVSGTANYLEGTPIGDYLKSSHYADSALESFFKSLEEENLTDNTIFIIYGDHEARMPKKQLDLLYNYDPLTNDVKDSESEDYYNVYGYNYDLLKNTPLIIWSSDTEFNKTISSVMGMYDVLPTVANMFGFEEKYSLGNDIFDSSENIVVFPNGNVLTDRVYYSDLNDEYITFDSTPIDSDYIDNLKEYADELLGVSNGIITHDLIKREGSKIGVCTHE